METPATARSSAYNTPCNLKSQALHHRDRHERKLGMARGLSIHIGFFRVTRRCNLFGRGREAPAEVVDEASGVGVGGTRATRGYIAGE